MCNVSGLPAADSPVGTARAVLTGKVDYAPNSVSVTKGFPEVTRQVVSCRT